MPTKFDVAQYKSNWNPTTKGSFVQTQNVMDDVNGMWSEVWTAIMDYLGTLSSSDEVSNIVQQSITSLLNDLFPSTSGSSSQLVTELSSWTGIDFNTLETQFDDLFSVSAWETWLSGDWTTFLSWFNLTPATVGSTPSIAQEMVDNLETDVKKIELMFTAPNMVLDSTFDNPVMWSGAPGAQTQSKAHSGSYSWQLQGIG